MTHIRLMSDLHLEFGPLALHGGVEDVLVLAGDIGIFTDGIVWAEKQSHELGIPVVMIAGNHEFYQNTRHRGHSIVSTLDALHETAAKTSGCVTFLERETATISGVRFIGATLWTDFNLFGNVARGISCGTINFGHAFSGKRAAAVRSITAVGVYNYFTPGKACVSRRPAKHKAPGGIYKNLDTKIECMNYEKAKDILRLFFQKKRNMKHGK